MSLFKKMVGFLFEEEEEVDVEGELETISIRDEEKKEAKRPRVQEVVKENVVMPRAESVPPVKIVKEVVQELPPQKEKQFNIELTKAEIEKPKDKVVRSTQRAKPIIAQKPSEYEFVPVISPIFGTKDTTSSTSRKKDNVPQTRATNPRAAKKNPLGTVISPIYGASELAEFEVEAREKIELAELKAVEPVAFDSDDNDDVVSISLEDLLAKEETSETEEDLLQFSLFGDDEMIKTKKEEDAYMINE